MAKGDKIGLGPAEEESGDDPIADALEIANGKRPTSEQVEAFCMAVTLAAAKGHDYEVDE
jgi:hypothetical protein